MWGFFKSPLQFDCSNQVQIWTNVLSCDQGLFWLKGNNMNSSKPTGDGKGEGTQTSHALEWDDSKGGGMGGVVISLDKTLLLNKETEKNIWQDAANGKVLEK